MAYRGMQVEPLDIDGLFWLADKPDDKVAGRLIFDPLGVLAACLRND